MKSAALFALLPLVASAEIYQCGPTDFSDRPCGPTVEIQTSRGWDSAGIMERNAAMLRSWGRRIARNRGMMPQTRRFEDRVRDRELRMERDRVLRQIERAPDSLGSLGLSFEVRELSRQREALR